MRRTSPFLLLALTATACTPQSASFWFEESGFADLEDDEYNPERIMVGLYPEEATHTPRFNRDAMVEVKRWDALNAVAVEVPAGEDALWVAAELMASGDYAYVEPDFYRWTTAVNDPYLSFQWHMETINVEDAWATSTGSGVVVAVIDTGVSTGGYDTPNMTTTGYDFVSNDSDPSDGYGHGTHVAGTVAQATNNGIGGVGVAYDAEIMAVRVLNNSGYGSTSDIIDGIVHAADNGANVINMSLGSTASSTAEEAAINYAASEGLVIVAASGNSSGSSVDYPARYSEVIAVGATRYDDTRAYYSNGGSNLDVVAPGGDTTVDQNGDGYIDGVLQETNNGGSSYNYYFYQGTSMAAPHVAGVGALLMSLGADRDEVRQILRDTATDLGSTGFDTSYGYGLIDAAAAVAAYSGALDNDGDGYTSSTDCDDTDAAVNPGAAEVCGDGIDNDCDGSDEVCPVDNDGDGYDESTDCDDFDAAVNPGAAEICGDSIDNNCSGIADDGDIDSDGDGFVDTSCVGGDDCDDGESAVNPGAAEVCEDGIDNNCDGSDEVCPPADDDGDGYDETTDCDDTDDTINPGATEICGDGIDNDCDGADVACPVDDDGDGYDITTDCDDTDAAINPGAVEVCGDGIDNDCDGGDEVCPPSDDDGDGYDETTDCDDTDAAVNPGATEVCDDGIDNDCDGSDETCPVDGDGDGFLDIDDCDDTDATIYPGAPDTCGDRIDSDCDGDVEACPPVDDDGDGYQDVADCDDNDASVNPGATEVCGDGIDQDCDGSDEVCLPGDVDGDGYDETTDCDDTDAAVNPGATEVCGDGVDQDCDGGDEVCPPSDEDGDGYDEATDCDDYDDSVYPGAPEVCDDGIDQDCDGVDEVCSSGEPTITDLNWTRWRAFVIVSWDTDEDTVGELCNNHGDCMGTDSGTDHLAWVRRRGSGEFTVTATDIDGDIVTFGPEAY